MCLYRQALGPEFDRLPETLRRFHSAPQRARGAIDVVRGAGFVRGMLARILRLPPPGIQLPVTVSVEERDGGEIWRRRFGRHGLVTRQWCRGGLLIEAAGPVRMAFRLQADPAGITFDLVRCWLLGVPLPRGCAPRIAARETGDDDGWQFHVRIGAPVLGDLTEYRGKVVAE